MSQSLKLYRYRKEKEFSVITIWLNEYSTCGEKRKGIRKKERKKEMNKERKTWKYKKKDSRGIIRKEEQGKERWKR